MCIIIIIIIIVMCRSSSSSNARMRMVDVETGDESMRGGGGGGGGSHPLSYITIIEGEELRVETPAVVEEGDNDQVEEDEFHDMVLGGAVPEEGPVERTEFTPFGP